MSHIKAGFLSGYPIRCSFCREEKSAARAYDVDDVTIFDAYGSPAAHGPITICEACRTGFGQADRELDALHLGVEQVTDENLPRLLASVKVQPYHDDEYEQALQPDEGGPEWNSPERHKHMAWKVRG